MAIARANFRAKLVASYSMHKFGTTTAFVPLLARIPASPRKWKFRPTEMLSKGWARAQSESRAAHIGSERGHLLAFLLMEMRRATAVYYYYCCLFDEMLHADEYDLFSLEYSETCLKMRRTDLLNSLIRFADFCASNYRINLGCLLI